MADPRDVVLIENERLPHTGPVEFIRGHELPECSALIVCRDGSRATYVQADEDQNFPVWFMENVDATQLKSLTLSPDLFDLVINGLLAEGCKPVGRA